MGVQPPADDDIGDGPDSIEFGIAALDVHLDDADLTFPASAAEVVETLGDPQVDVDPSGNAVALSTVVERADAERFESRSDLQDRLHPEFERLRRSSGGGFVSWLKTLLPGQ